MAVIPAVKDSLMANLLIGFIVLVIAGCFIYAVHASLKKYEIGASRDIQIQGHCSHFDEVAYHRKVNCNTREQQKKTRSGRRGSH